MKSLRSTTIATVAGTLLFAGQAPAAECPLTYETFEAAVPHIDMEECPEAEVRETAFCRASAGAEQVHLFYFGTEGDQCLIKVRSFDEGDYVLTLKPE